jgi:CBS domain-containing protein
VQVGDIMSQPVQTIGIFGTAQEAAKLMALHGIGALPVTEEGSIVGIVTDRDVLTRCIATGHAAELTPVVVFMSPCLVTTSPSDMVEDAAHLMAEHACRRLPVLDHGRAVGMLSVDDIARFCTDDQVISEMMRQVAGEIVPPFPRPAAGYALAEHVEYMDG